MHFFFHPIKPKCLPSSLLVSDIYASWCLDSPTDQCQPAQPANVILVLHSSQITQPTGYPQPSSQRAKTKLQRGAVRHLYNSLLTCLPGTGWAELLKCHYWEKMAAQAVGSDSSPCTWMGSSFQKHTIISFHEKQIISAKFSN